MVRIRSPSYLSLVPRFERVNAKRIGLPLRLLWKWVPKSIAKAEPLACPSWSNPLALPSWSLGTSRDVVAHQAGHVAARDAPPHVLARDSQHLEAGRDVGSGMGEGA